MGESQSSPELTARRFKPYPEYKNSGIEWLGKIPAHWEARRLKNLAKISSGFALPERFDRSLGEYPVYGSNGLIGYCDQFFILKNSLAVGRVGASGSVNIVPAKSWVSDNALLLKELSPSVCLAYLRYVLETMNLGAQAAKNAQPIITGTFLRNQSLITPPLSEQNAIAAFLDRETTKIDALIAKDDRLIELLQEKRTALITQAVTKGLDPNVPMQDSGVEWLGKIPAYWEVRMLKRLASMHAGAAITSEEIESAGKYPVFGGNGIRGYTGSFTHDGAFPLIGRQGALCGCINFVIGKFWASEHAVVAIPNASVDAAWLTYLLQAMSLNSYSESAAQPGLAVENIGALKALLPRVHEQRAIAAFLDRETATLDSLAVKIREAIERLKEYRTALISATVTGKIDVHDLS
jgi:type I restriction enzyme S subunit